MPNLLKFLVFILLVQCARSLHPQSALYQEIFAYHNETSEKADYAYEVVDKIYKAFRQWFFTIIFCEFTYFENRILKYTEIKDDGYPVLLLNSCPSADKRKVKPRIDKHGETAYIVTSNELSLSINEQVIEALIRTGVFKPRSPVVFVINLPVDVDSYFYFSIQSHFQLLWSRKITKSVLIVKSDKVRMYAYNPFFDIVSEVTNVSNVVNHLMNQYNNLHQHQLRLSVFRKIYVSDETGPVLCDSTITKTVMKHLNASCLPLTPRDGSTVGDLLDNGTVTGVTRDLIDGYTDLELNSRILKNSYYGYIDTTYPLFQDELCFLVKKSDRQSSFSTTIKLISVKMLLILMFVVCFLLTVGVCTRKYEASILGLRQMRTSTVLIELVKCFLRQTVDIKFLGPAFRAIALITIIYSLIIDVVMDSIIISAITYPRYKSDYNTMDELFESNFTFGVHNRHLKLFKTSLSEERFKTIENRIETFNDKKIKEFIDEREFQYAVLLRKSDAAFISRKPANIKNGRPIFHTVQECPIPCSIVYGLSYGSPYLPRINSMLHYFYQAGILQHWIESEERPMTSSVAKNLDSGEVDDTNKRKPLIIENLREVFFVWLIGLLISTVALFIEILYVRIVNRVLIVQ